MSILKVNKKDIIFEKIKDGEFNGSNIAEIFDTSGKTIFSCGIHEIFKSVTVVKSSPVSDVLYILEGEIEISSNGISKTYKAGDFAYLPRGEKQVYTVKNRVKHIYVCYPSNWKQ